MYSKESYLYAMMPYASPYASGVKRDAIDFEQSMKWETDFFLKILNMIFIKYVIVCINTIHIYHEIKEKILISI